jgi:hypothetical protein
MHDFAEGDSSTLYIVRRKELYTPFYQTCVMAEDKRQDIEWYHFSTKSLNDNHL